MSLISSVGGQCDLVCLCMELKFSLGLDFFCGEKEIMGESNIGLQVPVKSFSFQGCHIFLGGVYEYIQSPYHSYLIGESSFLLEFYQDYKVGIFYNVISFPEAKLHIGSFSFSLYYFTFIVFCWLYYVIFPYLLIFFIDVTLCWNLMLNAIKWADSKIPLCGWEN